MDIDLSKFCEITPWSVNDQYAKTHGRTNYFRDGWHYATDGSICVRLRTDKPDTVENTIAAHALDWSGFDETRKQWPSILQWSEICLCPSCGNLEDRMDCERCGGRGLIDVPRSEFVGGRMIAGRYLALVHDLPNAAYIHDDAGEKSPLKFVFDGGQGMVMPRGRM